LSFNTGEEIEKHEIQYVAISECPPSSAAVAASIVGKAMTEGGDADFLTSPTWGSIFSDEFRGSVEDEKVDERAPRVDTIWAHIIYKYCDVVIPQMDYITGRSIYGLN